MPEYRTPDEEAETAVKRARIQLHLDKAMVNATSVLAAMTLNETPEIVDMWVDKLWDELRDALNAEERLTAIVMLIQKEARERARATLKDVDHG